MAAAMLPMTGLAAGDTSGTAYAVEGGKIYFDSAAGTITGADDGITSANIPAKIDGAAVTSIGERAFRNCTDLASVVIPEGVVSIEMAAFSKCSGLTSVVVPEGVTRIEMAAFSGCTALSSVMIPSSVTDIGDFAFSDTAYYNTPSNWENGVLYMGPALIKAEESLSGEYSIKEGTTCIATDAFDKCAGLTSVVIPDGVKGIGGLAFGNCTGLTSLEIPKSVTVINDFAFFGCSGLTSMVIPEGVSSVGDWMFYDCSGLKAVIIPDSVTSIGEWAFLGCRCLESAIIPKNVTSIGEEAFYGCTGLTYVTIPSGVSYISEDAFKDCTGLSVVYFGGTKQQWESLGGDDAISGTGARVIFNNYPESSIDIATGETVFGSVLDNTLTVSGDVSAASPVYAALYGENGRMISCGIMTAPSSAGVSGAASAKLIWVSADGFTPKGECMEFALN